MGNDLTPELISRLSSKTKIKQKLTIQVLLLLWILVHFILLGSSNDFNLSVFVSPAVQWCLSIVCALIFSRFAFGYLTTLKTFKTLPNRLIDEVVVKEDVFLSQGQMELMHDFGNSEKLYFQKGSGLWQQDCLIMTKTVVIDGLSYVIKNKVSI